MMNHLVHVMEQTVLVIIFDQYLVILIHVVQVCVNNTLNDSYAFEGENFCDLGFLIM